VANGQNVGDRPHDRQKLFLEGPIGAALIRLAIPCEPMGRAHVRPMTG
jgi:hypothetical protein